MAGKMSEAASKVFDFPALANEVTPEEQERWSWFARRLYEAGVLDMAPSTKPPGFYVNWTTVTSLIVVVSAIVGLWYFTWQSATQMGFERGKAAAEQQQLLDRLTRTEEELRRTKDLKLVQAGQQAGHEEKKEK